MPLRDDEDASPLGASGAEKPSKKKKKTKKHHKAKHAETPGDASERKGNNKPEKIRKLIVKQQSTNEIQKKPTELIRGASSSTVLPVAGVTEPNERPVVQTEGYATGAYRMLLETKRAELLCESVMLRYNQVAHLKKLFDSEDAFHSGEITQEEFFSLIGEEKRKLSQGIFAYVGLPSDIKRLKFDDFVLCVVTFSTLSRPELLHYAFTLFDQDASGAMDERELMAFCGDLKNKGFFFEKNVQIAQKKLVDGGTKHGRQLHDGLVDYQDIANGSTQFPVAFYPILQFQRNIRASTLGEEFWIKVEERKQRVEVLVHYMRLHEGHLPSLSIQEHVRALFNREVYGLRKLAVVKYADEMRIWAMEKERVAAEKTRQLDEITEGEPQQ